MKKSQDAFLFSLVVGVLGIAAVQMGRGSELDKSWTTNLNQGLAKARTEGRPVLVEFGASWCGPCQQLRRQVFSTSEFKDATKDMILVYVDIDKEKALADQYAIGPIPDVRVISPKGVQLVHSVGFIELPEMLSVLSSAK